MGKVHIAVDPDNDNIANYARSYSYYDDEKEQRVIHNDQLSGRKIEENIEGHKKSSIVGKVKTYKENGLLTKIDDTDDYIVSEPNGSYVALPEDFVKQMISTFGSATNNVYA